MTDIASLLNQLEPRVLRCTFAYTGSYRDKQGNRTQGAVRIPDFCGSMLRGIFGRALHRLNCKHHNGNMLACPELKTCGCLYSEAFAAAGNRDSAKAFVLLAPDYIVERPYLQPGETLVFSLVFHPALEPMAGKLILAACSMADEGFGSRQAEFRVDGVEWIKHSRSLPDTYAPGNYLLTVEFTNPTELWEGEARSSVSLENILHSTAARAMIWSGVMPDHAALNQWLRPAAEAEPVFAQWSLAEGLQMEAETGERKIRPKAFTGVYRWKIRQGPLLALLPALRLLPLLGTGGRTTRGMGNVRVHIEPA